MNSKRRIGLGGRVALLVGIALGAALMPRPGVAGSAGSAADIKAAALAQVSAVAPDVPIVQIDLDRIVGDYATVIVYPQPGVTDPALVVLHNEDGSWTSIAGPGTAFPPGDSRAGAPDSLFDFSIPYSGDAGAANAGRIAPADRVEYQGAGFSFDYAADAAITSADSAGIGALKITGPQSTDPHFTGPAYYIDLQPLPSTVDEPFDDWAYDRLQQEIAQRRAQGGPASTYQPRSATYYWVGDTPVFQVDWFAGDSTIRDLYVQTAAGEVIKLTTRVYPVENNADQPLGDAAVALLLSTLSATK